MNHVDEALKLIRAGAQKAGGVSRLVAMTETPARPPVGVHTARAMIDENPQNQIDAMRRLEVAARQVLES